MQKIAIIIVTYNAMKWAEKCFSSIRNSSVPATCFVVDNGSTDGTQDFIAKSFPEVIFTQSSDNLGFGKANNIGIEQAYKNGADFFYLMNQDAWLYEDSLEKLMEVYQQYPNKEEIGILSPMHLDGSEKYLDIFLDKYIATNFEKTRLISDFYFQTVKPFYEINFINAAHWLLPKSTIDIVGGFNPYFFHYGEDVEYVNRLIYHKKKVFLCPKSKVVHDGKQILNKVNYAVYEDLSVETKIINPNLTNAIKGEKNALLQSILKNVLLTKFSIANKHINKFLKISKESNTYKEITANIIKKTTTFLRI